MSPFTRRAERPAERYPLHNTPERESRRSGVTSNKVAEERSAAKELQRMREQHAALLSSIEAQHAAQPLPEAQPSPPPQQPMPSPQLRIIAQTQLTQAAVTQQASRQRRSGSKNCSNKELLSLLRTIQRVLPIGPEMWEMVAQLHSINYSHCQRDGKSLKTKYLRLATEKPSTGNPNMSPATLLAKEIKLTIDLKVGNTPSDADEFFGEGDDTNNHGDDDSISEASPAAPPTGAGIPTVINAAPTVALTATTDNLTALTTTTKKKNRTNQIVSAMETNTKETKYSYGSIMEQRLHAEEAELRLRRLERKAAEEQRRIDREEDRRRREEMEEIRRQEREDRRLEREEERRAREEADERRRREREEERNHQQQQLLTMMQVVMSGAMAFTGMKGNNNNTS